MSKIIQGANESAAGGKRKAPPVWIFQPRFPTEFHGRTVKWMGWSRARCLAQTPESRRTALARVLRPFGLQPLQLGDHVPCPLNRDLNAFVILRQLFQLEQVTGPIHDAGVCVGLVGEHYLTHDIDIVPHRWHRFEARRSIRRSASPRMTVSRSGSIWA